jgi:hypothetical protein
MDETDLINEVLELTLACQRGKATPEEHARLERLLVDDPRAIAWYLRIVDDSLTLRDGVSSVCGSTDCVPPTAIQFEQDESLHSPPTRFRPSDYRNYVVAFAAIAGAILVGLSIRVWMPNADSSSTQSARIEFARIVELSNVEWADGAEKYDEWSSIEPGARLRLTSGWVNVFFSNGAELLIEGPADVRYDSSQKVFARQGKLAARIGPDAIGFRIETPHANVIDRGTEFGISVDGDSHTSVVVYKGIVDMDVLREGEPGRRRLQTGEALSVDSDGQLSRITTVESNEFLEPPQLRLGGNRQSRLITAVSDNVRSLETAKYYRIIRRGFREDCQAYVDRMHQWNGVDASGIPSFLLGGDYVMTFNDDKIANNFEITVTLSRPANLYLLVDERVPPPDWLSRDFVKTKWTIGSDEAYDNRPIHNAVGPGQSIEQKFSVWMRKVTSASTVLLGPLTREPPPPNLGIKVGQSMYGIVATPLREN